MKKDTENNSVSFFIWRMQCHYLCALYDEVFNHPVKQGTVIMAGFSQTYEVVPVNGSVIVEFHFHRPEVGFNQGKALFFLRQSQEGEKKYQSDA